MPTDLPWGMISQHAEFANFSVTPNTAPEPIAIKHQSKPRQAQVKP